MLPILTRALIVATVTLVVSLASVRAQSVGIRGFSLPNATSTGSANLVVRVHYPATRPGWNQPLRARIGGYPVVVFLHGQALAASVYWRLADALVAAGFVAVLTDTAPRDADLQVKDAVALFPTLVAQNKSSTFVLRGAFDMTRAGICGHSMGGGSTVRALAQNPGYLAGFGIAAWDGTINGTGKSWTTSAPAVKVPLGFVHGEGDKIVPWQKVGFLFYTSSTGFTGHKAFVQLDAKADHTNVAWLKSTATSVDREVHALCLSMVTGWFDHHLRGGAGGLEDVLGTAVRGAPRFKSIASAYRLPELWRAGEPKVGTRLSLRLGGEPGNGGIFLSPGTKITKLPFGILRLDPAVLIPLVVGKLDTARLLSATATIPNDPRLIGTRGYVQAITGDSLVGWQLTRSLELILK